MQILIFILGVPEQNFEVPELCQLLIGKWAEILAKVFSVVVLIGANIVYWILMSNFLYYSVYLIYGKYKNQEHELFFTISFQT